MSPSVSIFTVERNLSIRFSRFRRGSGRSIGEPVAWCGPIVMSTQKELKVTFEEYQNGTFVKHRGKVNQ